jgi:bifunctional DNA-binding transcriptional regulator/antitoxin component of YhaV-PrlF toxin-antitoxin module
MPLVRAFAKVDKQRRLSIPGNIYREMGLKPGELLELKILGPNKAPKMIASKKRISR